MVSVEFSLEGEKKPIRIRESGVVLHLSVKEGRKLSNELRMLTDKANELEEK